MLLATAALALLVGSATADFTLTLLSTHDVRGSAFPVSEFGSECRHDFYADKPCKCYGGAARRAGVLAAASDPDVVSLDSGDHFFGGGSFFPAFGGVASAELFAACGYEAYGLRYRDFSAFANSSSDGAAALSAILDRMRAHDPTLPLPVVSNLDVSGVPSLESRIARSSVVPLGGGRTLGVITLFDQTDLHATNPTMAARCHDWRRGLTTALADLRAAGMPTVVVVVVQAAHAVTLDGSAPGKEGESISETIRRAVLQLAAEEVEVDVFLAMGSHFARQELTEVDDWAGGRTLIATQPVSTPLWSNFASKRRGEYVLNLTVSFDDNGVLVPNASVREVIHLDCNAAEDATVKARLAELHAEMTEMLSLVVGELKGDAGADRASPPPEDGTAGPVKILPGGCANLPAGVGCGCYVADCQAGMLIADALQHVAGADVAFVNGGGVRAGFLNGPVTKLDLGQALPFFNELIRVTVSGAAIKAALEWGLSNLAQDDAIGDTANGRFLQVSSSVSVKWFLNKKKEYGVEVSDVKIDGIALVSIQPYTVALGSYIARTG